MTKDTPDASVAPATADAVAYRVRARAVRAAARLTLRDFRAERRARSRGLGDDAEVSAASPVLTHPHGAAEFAAQADAMPDEADRTPFDIQPAAEIAEIPAAQLEPKPGRVRRHVRTRGTDLRLAAGPEAPDVSELASPDDLLVMTVSSAASAVARHAMTEAAGAAEPNDAETPSPAGLAAPATSSEIEAVSPEVAPPPITAEVGAAHRHPPAGAAGCDLDRLPGAGPGLVWMLRQAGVRDLGDLAQADADALAGQLGLVGRLIDIGAWIAQARSMVETAADAPDRRSDRAR